MKKIFLILNCIFMATFLNAQTIKPSSPSEAYLERNKVLSNAVGLKDLSEYIPREQLDEMIESISNVEKEKEAIDMLRAFSYMKEINILSEEIDGNNAKLIVEGISEMGANKGEINMVLENEKWKVMDEEFKAVNENELSVISPKPAGYGSLSGTITLPEPIDEKQNGNIYVILMQGWGEVELSLYKEIPSSEIVTEKVKYEFANVPAGSYTIYAVWDIVKPYIDVESARRDVKSMYGDDKKLGVYLYQLSSLGDFIGHYGDFSKLEEVKNGSGLTDINIEFTQKKDSY